MTPHRCPACTFPVPAPGRCAVCASGVPVQRITVADMRAAYDAQLTGASQVQQTRTRPAPKPVARKPAAQRPAQALREVPCDMPDCPYTALMHPNGYARLKGAGHPVRCADCKSAHRQGYQRTYMGKLREANGDRHPVDYPCSMPECTGTRTLKQREARRLHNQGAPIRCLACVKVAGLANKRAWAHQAAQRERS